MPDDKTTLERIAALEQKVSTEQAMRVALLTDITARLDMLEHRAGDVPPADPASEVPLTRDEAEEIAKACAQAAAALPQAPSYLTTVNMRGWRPHAWVVDAVVNGAYRSRIGQGDMKVALSELTDALKRDQNATCVRIAKLIGVYRDDDDDEYDLDTLLGMLEAKVTQLRQDACGACDAQRAAMEERDLLRDQRNAMRVERDQTLARISELEEQLSDMQASYERAHGEADQARREYRHLRDARQCECEGIADANTRLRADVASMSGDIAAVLTATGTRTIAEATEAIAKLKAESIADVIAKLEQLRGQVANLTASSQWYGRWCELQDSLADALGMARQMWTEPHLIDQVRTLKARASGGVTHE